MKTEIFNLLMRIPHFLDIYKFYKEEIQGRENKKSLGKENPDKTFYIIGQNDTSGGVFWLVNKVAMHIAYALDKGYIPVVDFQNYVTQYTEQEELGKTNFWDKLFEQPFGYYLKDIANSKHIVINKMAPAPQKRYLMGQIEFYDNPQKINYYKEIFKKYIIINKETQKFLDSIKDEYFPKNSRVLGVLCRGTDYVVQKPKNHPVQPKTEQVIEDAKNVMKEYHCEYLFLATEDQDILDSFQKEMHEKILFLPQRRYTKEDLHNTLFLAQAKEEDKQRNRLDDAKMYLASIYLLTKCNCFIGGRTGGTKGVLLMEQGFEYKYIYDLGLYK